MIVDTLLRINSSWKKYVVNIDNKITPTIYSDASKALYETVDASKLFFKDLFNVLINELGFTRNPYNVCVINKKLNDKQATIVWHVDNLKISHAKAKILTSILDYLSVRYGGTMPLTISRGKIHKYLGMTFDYTKKGKVKVIRYDYIDGILDNITEFWKEGIGMKNPAPNNL